MHSKVNPSPMRSPEDHQFVVSLSLLDRVGRCVEGYDHCIVEFNQVLAYIGKHQSTKSRYIFCNVEKESVGSQFYARVQRQSQWSMSPNSSQPMIQMSNQIYMPQQSQSGNQIASYSSGPDHHYSQVCSTVQHPSRYVSHQKRDYCEESPIYQEYKDLNTNFSDEPPISQKHLDGSHFM